VRLTADGRRVFQRLESASDAFRHRLLASLDPGAAAAFVRNLSRVAEAMAMAAE
jgi:DNA-binding MarR family transcriptional regulator